MKEQILGRVGINTFFSGYNKIIQDLILNNKTTSMETVFIFEDLSYQEIATLFKRNGIIISGGSNTKLQNESRTKLKY
jgi:cysteine sulfinate desulfinase/cysteine desulfurase-like protein